MEKESEQLFLETDSAFTATMIRRVFIGVTVDMCIMATQETAKLCNCKKSDKVIKLIHLLP